MNKEQKVLTENNVSSKRICVCTDDRDADDLFNFGLDWVVRQAHELGIEKTTSWSMGSLHPATRYNIDRDYGALGHSRRADIVMINDNLEVLNTWIGGHLAVENKKITWFGDCNNVLQSWIEASGLLNFELNIACQEGINPDEKTISWALKRNKNIYGTVTAKEADELNDEGIDLTTIPWIDNKEN